MSFKKLLCSSLLSIGLLFSNAVIAGHTHEAGDEVKHQKKQRSFKKLSLEQRQQVKELMKNYRTEFKALHKEMRATKKQLKAQYNMDKPVWNNIQPLIEKMNQTRSKAALLRAKFKFDVYQKTGIKLPSPKFHHRKKKQSTPR